MKNKIQILIIEDEAIIAENIKNTLEDFDFEIVCIAYNYEDGLNCIEKYSFDLLLLDINLGHHFEKTGLDIASQIPKLKDIPFVFLTAFSDIDTITKASKLNPSAYLVKPASGPTLFAAIQTALENFNNKKKAELPGEDISEISHFFIKSGIKITKVLWNDVYALVSMKNYVKVITIDNPAGYLMRTSLQQALTKIVPFFYQNKYIQINRNTAIDKNIIKTIYPDKVLTLHGEFESSNTFLNQILKNKI